MPPKKLGPAALGGLFIGVLSALPVVNVANCCCLWILGGGYLAAYLMQQDHPFPITATDGALVGLLSGIFGAVVFSIVAIPIGVLMAPLQAEMVRWFLSRGADLPPGMRDMLGGMPARSSFAIGIILQFVAMLVIGSLFAALGGLLGAVFSRRPPAPPASVPPSSAPPVVPPAPGESDLWPPQQS